MATAAQAVEGKNEIKTIYLIRHAESEENRRLASLKNCFGAVGRFTFPSYDDVSASVSLLNIPGQVDSNVSPDGKVQIANLAQQLLDANFIQTIQLVAHSPLKRARQTSDGMLQCSAQGETILQIQEGVKRVVELDLLTEKTPAEWLPGNLASLTNRIHAFEAWIGQQPESSIAIVGHSQYFKAMLDLDFKFGNCDVWQAQYATSGTTATECNDDTKTTTTTTTTTTTPTNNEQQYKTPRGWFGLKRLYQFTKPVEAT